MKIVPVILSGGSGTRLWPLSRKQYPKQYLPLTRDNTMFQADTFIEELTAHAPNIVNSVNNAVNTTTQDLDFIRLEKQAFESSPSNSIDYALMERSDNVVVVPLDVQWNDIGAWPALYDIGTKDKSGI
jgi:mannose-1-phosphate guanylyltransferase